ncbi:response regulator [Falsiroseomonas sp. E2-1-a20]|uniref:response regulator n=1 Tax=Falsiroseomonas sp. E2-1-a20 TaxID=3239300 RepID=UPI003F59C903
MRVLIVEDEELIRMLVRDLLEEAGFSCRDASDADEVTAILDDDSGWQPDLLVTDYNLGQGPNTTVSFSGSLV